MSNKEKTIIYKIFIIMKLVLKNSAIKGHHLFKIIPLKDNDSRKGRENEFDPYAMIGRLMVQIT